MFVSFLLIYTFFIMNFCVSVLLINSFFYYSAIHMKLCVCVCVCVCVWQREEEGGDIFLADPTLVFP